MRIGREVLSNQVAETSKGQCCLKHLRKSLIDKVIKLSCKKIQSQHLSVITPTPPESPKPLRASTPRAQTVSLHLKQSVTLGQIDLHIPPNSPSCREINSIGDEVLQAEVSTASDKILNSTILV